jgi:hypothetical protein
MTEADFTPSASAAVTAAAEPGEIVARAGRYYRNARYVMALVCFATAAWFAYDGWVKWPHENQLIEEAKARQEKPQHTTHGELDLAVQKSLAMSLPILGLGIIVWLRFNSRGSYRLADDVLYVPGHPPVPLSAVREIDKTKWEKKGIAYLDYELDPPPGGGGAGKTGTIVLDDFVYQQQPTDRIMETIEKKLAPVDAEGAVEGVVTGGEASEGTTEV